MIVKRYIVNNMQEAMIRIRYELGNDAVIISQRKIRQKGILGFFKRRKLEVTAAVDDKNKKNDRINSSNELEKEINELKNMVESLVKQQVDSKRKIRIKDILTNNDVPEDIVDEIINLTKKKFDNQLSFKELEKQVKNTLKEILVSDKQDDSRIQVFIGPTGVGKTTTIAKLASIYSLYKNKKVGLITIDTYRIGAVEQLRLYAEILGVPFNVVYSLKDIPEILNKMKDCDIILIDTTGRNSKNSMQIAETKKFIEEFSPDKIYLVLSLTTKQRDLRMIIENYKNINYNSLIFTKLDETDSYGGILTAVYLSKRPVSYLTLGQGVPDDIEEANSDKLLNLVLWGNKQWTKQRD
ncbi:flagellar biosynthesis protein FlhF [Caloramator fervidus]|uniref:Flagellar biosynthesis protein FlhF n=1 Tax=Caloramator fervidus TaxID=29344 RepID=A0A1H5SBB9_9CLOT|nr:flagellar biosynthesis protein FlhF [Caloramator fervidus]SEF47805.1 flagellar biosynthesis protein FlhF [Caloramator fervidus]